MATQDRSPGISIARKFTEERADIIITGPKALKNAENDLSDLNIEIQFIDDPCKAALTHF